MESDNEPLSDRSDRLRAQNQISRIGIETSRPAAPEDREIAGDHPPLSVLPAEILSLILALAIEPKADVHNHMPLVDVRRRSAAIIQFRLVCRQWDALITSTTQIWNHICIPLQDLRYNRLSFIEKAVTSQLVKLGSAPFTLEIVVSHSSATRFRKLAVLLRPQLSQCRRLHLTSYYGKEVAAATEVFITAEHRSVFSGIDTLILEWFEHHGGYRDHTATTSLSEVISHITSSATSLRTLELCQNHSYDNTGRLEIPQHDDASLRAAFIGSDSFSALTTLKVSNLIPSAVVLELITFCAPSLERVIWQTDYSTGDRGQAVSPPLRQIHLPCLGFLNLHGLSCLVHLPLFPITRLHILRLGFTLSADNAQALESFFSLPALREIVTAAAARSLAGSSVSASLQSPPPHFSPPLLGTMDSVQLVFVVKLALSSRLDEQLANALDTLLQDAGMASHRTPELSLRETQDAPHSGFQIVVGIYKNSHSLERYVEATFLYHIAADYPNIVTVMEASDLHDYLNDLSAEGGV